MKNQLSPVVPEVVANLRRAFVSRRTRPLVWRRAQLRGLFRMLEEQESEIVGAICADVGKPPLLAFVAEVAEVKRRIKTQLKMLDKWTSATKASASPLARPAKAEVVREPLGVVLVIAPWNFPVELSLTPLIGALAAGNCVLLKPSEVAPACAALLAKLLPRYVDAECIQVVEGGVSVTTELLKSRFDHIFYTGNSNVGRIVMRAASEHLTPVTLELGGKSPCIVDASADLDVAARRIAWGKFMNVGQVCVAPDYALVDEKVHDLFVKKLQKTIKEFFGADPTQSSDYGRMVNARHHRRVMALLDGAGTVVCGGQGDEQTGYIAPTILTDVPVNAQILQEEIFGPLLPIIKVADLGHAIEFVNQRPKALALYIFAEGKAVQRRVVDETSSGGMVVNGVLHHILGSDLPFGGVGESGMGSYHGKYSIDTFSHLKSVLTRATWIDPKMVYPPVQPAAEKWIRRLA